jgi:hypothetical protein
MSLTIGGTAHWLSAAHALPGGIGLALAMHLFGTSKQADALLLAQSGLIMLNMAQMLLLEQFMVEHEKLRVLGKEAHSFKSGLVLATAAGLVGLTIYWITWGVLSVYGRASHDLLIVVLALSPATAFFPLLSVSRSVAYCEGKAVPAEALSLCFAFAGTIVPLLMLIGWMEPSAWRIASAQSLCWVGSAIGTLYITWPESNLNTTESGTLKDASVLAAKTGITSLKMKLAHNIHPLGSLAVINWMLSGMPEGATASFFYAKRISDAAFYASSAVPFLMITIKGAKASIDVAARQSYPGDCSQFWRRGLTSLLLAYIGAAAACAALLEWGGMGAFSGPFWMLWLIALWNAVIFLEAGWVALLVGAGNSRIFMMTNSFFLGNFALFATIGVWSGLGAYSLPLAGLVAQISSAAIFRHVALRQLSR